MTTEATTTVAPPADPNASPPVTIILTTILLVIFFIGFFTIYICRCFMQNVLYTWNSRRNQPGAQMGGPGNNGATGLDPHIIKTFPTYIYSDVKKFRRKRYGLECAICLCEFEDDNVLRILTKCYHVFHQDCIDLWLESHKSCPFCRRGLETPLPSPEKSPISQHSTPMHEIHENELLEDTYTVNIGDENEMNNNTDATEENKTEKHVNIDIDRGEVKRTDKFPRSKSTGHSITKNSKTTEDEDKFTLRLPEHIQAKLIHGHTWTRSCTEFGEFKTRSTGSIGLGEASTAYVIKNSLEPTSGLHRPPPATLAALSLRQRQHPPGISIFSVASINSAMDSTAKSFNPNKHLKEQFVSNLTGSSTLEVFLLSAIFPMLILLRHIISIYKTVKIKETSSNQKDTSRTQSVYIIRMTLDFLSIVLPITLFCTVLSEWTYMTAVVFISILFFSFAYKRHESWYQEEGNHSLREYISSYRVSMMLITCICILAVDFNIFPRRYAKTETYGTSLMDLGVGAFVFANSLVSRQARGISTMGLKCALSSTSPLLVLGFARLVFTSGVDYQVHVGEYGVHWNFFFTLAGVAVLTSLINISPNYCGLVGSFVLIVYQICLMSGLNVYLLSDERGTDIISQNKEGIYSIFGYWGLHLIGVWLGNSLLFGENANLKTNKYSRKRVWILFIFFWCLTLVLDNYVERPSRRMCNLTYVTLVLATNLQTLGIIMLSDYIPGGGKISLLEQAINRNLLAVFIVANLLTGLVNLSINTLFATPLTALIILIAYGFIVCCAAGFADYNGIKLKFW
ncbi:hypothetical protein LXL04_005444 [Taraxacum kok-saghyz]